MIKLLIGGSPCTHWSIAQKNNRETKPEGLGWELFLNYLIAKEKFKPDFFLYENNKSAAQPIKDEISKQLGVELMYINSALVSAQNRQRFYAFNWVVEQPEDRGILLKDIIDYGLPFRNEKSPCVDANYYKGGSYQNLTSQAGRRLIITEPVSVAKRGRYSDSGNRTVKGNGPVEQYYEARDDKKSNALTTVQKDNFIAEPVNPLPSGKARTVTSENPNKQKWDSIAEPLRVGKMPKENGELSTHKSKQYRVYSADGKSTTLCGEGGGLGAKTGLYALPLDSEIGYATPVKWNEQGEPTLAASGTDGKTYTVYKVENGLITIKDKQYPIKLEDGYWIIRPLTVKECCRLQTLPDDYCKAVSPTQAKKGLGNGWTAEVIIHILNGALKNVPKDEEIIVLSMYDGIGTGRYCLDKMGFTNVKYYAYEIDKFAMAVANDNYPDIIQCGDAFAVRNDDWRIERKDIPNEIN